MPCAFLLPARQREGSRQRRGPSAKHTRLTALTHTHAPASHPTPTQRRSSAPPQRRRGQPPRRPPPAALSPRPSPRHRRPSAPPLPESGTRPSPSPLRPPPARPAPPPTTSPPAPPLSQPPAASPLPPTLRRARLQIPFRLEGVPPVVAAAVLLLRCTVLGLSSEAGIRPCLGGRFRLLVRNASSVGLLVELRFGSIDCSIPDPSSSPAWRGFVCCLRGVLVAAYFPGGIRGFN